MKKLSISLFLASLFFGQPILAGPGHSHSHEAVSSEQVSNMAMTHVTQMIKKGKIDQSWQALAPVSVEKKVFKNSREWQVTFQNTSIKDPAKQKLFMFFSMDGHYLAANYTGN